MNMNRPDMTETVKSENYTNKFLQKDSNPVTMKASKSPATESSDQTKAAKHEPLVYRVEEIAQLLAISPRAAYNLCNTTKDFRVLRIGTSIRVNKQLYSKQSDYQRIDIFETPEFGRVLTLDGNVMLTERDEFIYDEMIVHVPMAVHREAKDILVIGAGDGGVVRELTRYDRVERIDLVEMDPQVVEACRAYLPGNACRMDDRRVHIYFENALKFIRQCEEEYDLIIVDSSDPFGPSEGLFTREFYGSCFNALKEDGIMVNQQGSPFYAEDANAMQRSHKRIASTFPISRVYQAHIPTFAAGYWLFGFASKKYHPIDDLDAAAWKALNMRTRYYTTKLHIGAFYLPAFLEEMLREVEEH